MSEITRYPLTWPDNVARRAPGNRQVPRFDPKTVAEAAKLVLAELNRLNERAWHYEDDDVIISTNIRPTLAGTPASNQAEPADPGVAVYFKLRFWRGNKQYSRHTVLTCDKWTKVSWNLYAIARDIEAQRARARWGCGTVEQAFRGYLAIPERTGGPSWWEALGISPAAGEAEIQEAFKRLATTAHPDKGGSHEAWVNLQTAYEQALQQFKR